MRLPLSLEDNHMHCPTCKNSRNYRSQAPGYSRESVYECPSCGTVWTIGTNKQPVIMRKAAA